MTEDQTQPVDDDATERIPDEDDLALTQWVAKRAPAVADRPAQATPGEKVGAASDEQTQPLAGDETQPFAEDQTQPFAGDETQTFAGDETQTVSRDRTQPMDDERTERVWGDPDVEDTYVHFGPGVPAVLAPTPPPDRATAIWRGATDDGVVAAGTAAGTLAPTTVRTPRPGGQRWTLPLTVLILVVAVVLYFLFGRSTPAMSITNVSVHTSAATVDCSGQETLTGVITTDGGAGTITYQWVRSDGTKSAVLHQVVNSGSELVDVTLVWNFEGVGSMHASAVLDVLGPGTARSASTSFDYICSG